MMSVTVEQHINDNYYISIEIEHRYDTSFYVVQACPRIDESRYGYPERSMSYHISEKKKAYDTYRRYKRKYI